MLGTQVNCGHNRTLFVMFANGVCKKYDCSPLLKSEIFNPPWDESFFRLAHVEARGDAIVWNDEINIAELEIWLNGEDCDTTPFN